MILFKVCIFLTVATAVGVGQELADLDRYLDPFDPNPRFIVKNGHLMVMTGRNKDLLFRSSGTGRVKINGDDIAALKGSIASSSSDQTEVVVRPDNLPPSSSPALSNQMALIEAKMVSLNVTIQRLKARTNSILLRRVRTLTRRLNRLERLLNKDECSPNPCKNGGECEDGFNKYICRCVLGFTGTNCDEDVNECEHYQGTELGCQNGATCLNTFGDFHCICPANFQGVRCTVQFNDCKNASSQEICGNGECYDLPRTSSGVARYRCVCHQGFTKSSLANSNSETAPCDVDVDECATGVHRCSKSPPVACINTRAGYQCGPCPFGYSGDGYICTPTDLCNVNNGGCSMSPRVSCFSNLGRVICGPCPPGFIGDGTICSQLDGGVCSSNNGGCSPVAQCTANTAISVNYRDCRCPPGTTGTGVGANGCTQVTGDTSSMSCQPTNPCQNGGTCIPYRSGVYCSCPATFSGTFCENHSLDACSSNPCQNNGVCTNLRGGYSCYCTNEYTGKQCTELRSSCGGVLDAEKGILSYPIANGTAYNANLTCSWVIKNTNGEGKVLNITFTRFNVEFSTRCAFDFVELIDGPSQDYKSLGRFCGQEIPKKTGNFISSFNAVMVRFGSDQSVGYEGFTLQWSTIEPFCGGLHNISNGSYGVMIESPGFPHHYPSLLHCIWDFVAPFGQRIQFVFTHLDIESSPNCTYDFLEIKEGSSGNLPNSKSSHTIMRFCNWTSSSDYLVPPPITTSGSFAQVIFHSDNGISGKGFQLLFHQVPGICGGLLTGNSGTFNPPLTTTASGSLVYENGVQCEWLIRMLPMERVLLRFLRFSLEQDATFMTNRNGVWRQSNRTCMFDVVEVFDGGDSTAPLMARLCGSVRPPEMISSGRFMRVRFRSDVSVARQGFTAQYVALCGGEYDATNTERIIESPNYPEPVMSKNCTYLIRAPYGHIIKLEIFEIDIEFDHRCLFDYIFVPETGQRYCGKLALPPIFSMGSELKFIFVNDDTKPSKGFRARFKAIEIGCGGTLKQGLPMVAISPEHIKENPLVQQCFWEIQANKSYIVVVKFVHTEASTDTRTSATRNLLPCAQRSSYIMVNDTDGTLITKFCPDQLPPAISSTGQKLFITYIFRSTPAVQQPINNTLPPSGFRTANITLLVDATLLDHINAIDFPSFEPMIRTPVSDAIDRNAFYANYFFKKARKYCNRNLFGNSGVIRSPNYPRFYSSNLNCTTVIHVDNGLRIRLNFTFFQIEPASDVNGQCFDYLELRNGRNADSPLIAKMCGHRPLPDILSHSNYLFARFISDSSMQRGGFSAYYTAEDSGCGGLLTADSGSIESPDYPLSYSSNLNCEYKIILSQGSAIQLYIVALNLEIPNNGQCLFDYIQIWDGETDGSKSFGRFCSMTNNANGVITSASNKMLIRFTSDATVNQGGFKLNYRTLCNRTLTGTHGVIESPNYPNPHPHSLNCNYHLLAPLGNNLTIIFTALSLEAGYNCMFDHINVSQVNRWPRPLMLNQVDQIDNAQNSEFNVTTVKVLCGNLTGNLPAPIQLPTNEAIVSFVSDESRSIQSGFRLEFGSVGCGGRFDERPSGNLSSPGYPNPYPRGVECLWHIQAPLGRRIDLVVHNLDMEYSKTCSFDFVQVLGPDEKSPELARLCNQISDRKISSIGSFMTIRMVSDGSSTRKGFTASFTTENTGCGGKFTTSSGTLTSPNYGRGNTYDPSSDCSFSLVNEGHFNYELTINDLDIPSHDPNCSQSSYLAIYDSESEEEGRLLAKICNSNRADLQTIFNSTNSVLFLRFKADGITVGHGFNATYKTVCGKILQISDQEDIQVISSPNFPHVSSLDDHCHFILKAANPKDTVTVRLTHLQSFNIPFLSRLKASNECSINFLEFYDGTERVPMKRLHHFCSDAIPPPIISSGDSLLLVSYFTIFRALASTAKSFCGGDFHVIEGYITSPGYPNSYSSVIECIWILKASPGNRYELDFDDFDLEESDYCNGDYVEIRQSNSSGLLIGDRRLCGSGKDNLPSLDFSFSGDVWIKFRTDEANVAKGFMLHFKLASNVILGGETGQVASPGYPNAFHFFNRTFTYQIAVPSTKYVKLHFDEMQLNGDEGTSNICSIKLLIYNGLVNFDRVDPSSLSVDVMSGTHMTALPDPKVSYCSSIVPSPFVSDNNAVTVVYTAVYFYHLPSKFHITWSAINRTQMAAFDEHVDGIPNDVNSTFNFFVEKGQSVNIADGNYSQYGSDINWYLTTTNSMHFNLSSSLISFHPSSSCWINKITVSAWASTGWRTLKTLCNGYAKQVELAGTNLIRVHLQFSKIGESGSVYPRYNMTIFPVCGGNFTDPSGTISTEDAQDGYNQADNQRCLWLIKARPGRTLQLTLEFYSIGFFTSKCSNTKNFLEIRNGHSEDSPLLVEPLCGSNTTSFLLPETSSNVAHLTYKSASKINNFRLHYKEVSMECGGELVLHSMTDSVVVSSPDYPASPEHGDLVCNWIIRGPITSGLLLSFSYEPYAPCDKNNTFLEVYNGGTELSSLIDKFCMPTHMQNSVVISSHITLLRYVLHNRDFRSKFNATIRPDNCNREFFVGFTGSAQKMQLPFAGKALVGPNFKCSLHLRTHPSYYILANITSINLQGNNCSSGDSIQFRDSPSAKYAFDRRCAPYNNNTNNMVSRLNSFQNELYILFERKNYRPNATDDTFAKKNVGVTLSLDAKYRRCGQTILGSFAPIGKIRSPGYPGGLSRRLYCSYKLIGEPGTVFKLSFVRFNLGRTPPNVNISMFRCQKRLQISRNLYMKQSQRQSFGCSNEFPPDITSLSNMMELYFYASELKPREGFNVRYEMVYDNESCSALLDLPRGQIVSANFNNLNYTGLVGCAWEVKVNSSQSATLIIDTFDIAGDCSNSSITTTTITSDPQSQFSSFNCITKEMAPQTTKTKYIMPIYSLSDTVNPVILVSFNRTDAGISKGLRGEYVIQNCGGGFVDFEGEFTSPNYPNDLGTEVFCNWYFRLSDGAMEGSNFNGYRLIFSEFDIGESCNEDYFFILKPRYEQHSREKFCKRDGLPKPLYVGHDLLLSFVSSHNLSLSGSSSSFGGPPKKFKFRLERARGHGCGGVLLAGMSSTTSSYIQSPNYDDSSNTIKTGKQYANNIECVWEVRSFPDFHLEFNFNSRFDIENSANCTNDFVLFEEKQLAFVGDTEVESWKVLNRLCGHNTPTRVVSSTNFVRVTFRTNDKVVGDGFRAQFKHACGGLFQEDSGIITSPRYSEGTYSTELSCLYRIQRASNEYISVTFEDFDLEYHSNCDFDKVTIYSGDHQNKSTPISGPYCGTTLPPVVTALGLIEVQFKSDYYFNKRGFKFSWRINKCGGNETRPNGTIVGPEIPPNSGYKTCVWRITVPNEMNSVAVRITALDLANEHCRTDCCNYLKIYDGSYRSYDTSQLGNMCANDHQDLTFKSSSNIMTVVFRQSSLEANKAASFKLIYWSTLGPKSGCGGTVRTSSDEVGVITSPDTDGDSNYEANLSCLWAIMSGSVGSVIQLEFERFDLETGSNGSTTNCDNDWLDVFEGTTMHAPLLVKLCGSTVPEKIQSSGDSLLLHFVTNDNGTGHGFRLRYSSLNQTCGGFLYALEEKQEITSPSYPNGYSAPLQCTWTLGMGSAYYKKPMVLIFKDLDLNCSRGDYVQLVEKRNYDYDRTISRAITLCTSQSAVKIITTEQISMSFRSDTTARMGLTYDNQQFANTQADGKVKSLYKGFRMTYHSTLCNETLDGMDNGYANNRYYPNSDFIHRTTTCNITIVVPTDHQIALYFSSFSFYHCHYSNFSIYEGNSTLAKAIFCNMKNPPSPVFSTSNSLKLIIRSSYMSLPDHDYSKPVYTLNRILYSFNYISSPRLNATNPPGCGGNLTSPNGLFSSPLYPVSLTANHVCTWRISTNGYHSLTLKFSFFQLSPSCDANRVVIYDGDEDIEDKKLATFCNSDTPAPIRSKSNQLLVKLYTTMGNFDAGFLASYVVNTYEPEIRGRVISSQTFKYYKYQNTFSHL